jgi:hypothetical protein
MSHLVHTLRVFDCGAGYPPFQAQPEHLSSNDAWSVRCLCSGQLVLLWCFMCWLLGLWKQRDEQCHLQHWPPQVDGCHG